MLLSTSNQGETKATELIHNSNLPDGPAGLLIRQLPRSLHKYVRYAQPGGVDDLIKSSKHGVLYHTAHTALRILCFPWALMKMVLVKKGEIALTWYGESPKILGAGRHYLLAPTNRLERTVNLSTTTVIKHGPIHIIVVDVGRIGLGTDMQTGNPIILGTGTHIIKSDYFQFNSFSTLTEPVTQIGCMKLVRVERGMNGYGYRGADGELVIYEPGLHLICPPDNFVDLLSMQIRTIQLPEETHETKDYVAIKVRAAVYYRVSDPYKALAVIGGNVAGVTRRQARGQDGRAVGGGPKLTKIRQQIQELGTATLQQIVRSSALVDIAGGSSATYSNHPTAPPAEGRGEPNFYQRVHDQFMSTIHDHILENWGIDISNLRIESLNIADRALATSIAKQAVTVSEQEARHLMLTKETEIITVQANNKARELQIRVDAEAMAIRTKATADSEAIVLKARAEKEAQVLKGQGEAKYAELLTSTKLGTELARLRIQSKAISGIKSVAYVPHLPGILEKGNAVFNSDFVLPKT